MNDHEFRLPDIGEGLEEAEIVEWLVSPGDTVRRDQPLVEILTDKSQAELPSPVGGVIASLGFAEGDMATVGDLLVVIETDETAAATPAAAAATPAPPAAGPAPVAPAAGRGRVKASPATRRRAREAGIDLTTVTGTGPGGRITADDLAAAGTRPAPAAAALAAPTIGAASPGSGLGQIAAGTHRLRGIRRATARAMERAWTVPHIHGMDEIDATNLMAGRRRIRELVGPAADHLTPLAFFVTAVARALRRYPMVNASIDTDADEITVHADVNIGIAVATDDGLIVPVVTHADRRNLLDLATEIGAVSEAARMRSVTADQLRGGTCTISNYGSLGGRFATPIIRNPEVAIVGFGAIRDRPFVVDGEVVARPTLPISTAVDHRLIDGDLLTAFQEHIAGLLTDPVALMVS